MKAPSVLELKQDEENQHDVKEMFLQYFQDQRGKVDNEFRRKKASRIREDCWKELRLAVQDALDIQSSYDRIQLGY